MIATILTTDPVCRRLLAAFFQIPASEARK